MKKTRQLFLASGGEPTGEGLLDGTWLVCPARYEWVEGVPCDADVSDEGPWLVARSRETKKRSLIQRSGQLVDALGRLAATPTQARIARHARTYGFLTQGVDVAVDDETRMAESLQSWVRALAEFGLAYRIKEALKRPAYAGPTDRQRDSDALADLHRLSFWPSSIVGDYQVLPSQLDRAKVSAEWEAWDGQGPFPSGFARYVVLRTVADQLRGAVDAVVQYGGDLRFFPHHPLAAAWLHLGLSLTDGAVNQRPCESCGRPMSGRRNKKYCEPRCRARVYEQKHPGRSHGKGES